MERILRADVVKMLHRVNELTDRVLLLEKEVRSIKHSPVAGKAAKAKATAVKKTAK